MAGWTEYLPFLAALPVPVLILSLYVAFLEGAYKYERETRAVPLDDGSLASWFDDGSLASWFDDGSVHSPPAAVPQLQLALTSDESFARATWGGETDELSLTSWVRERRWPICRHILEEKLTREPTNSPQGHSYQEICELTGWTYTKVNRCLTEGRKRFFARYEGIESGAECERWAPVLSAVADGEASTQDMLAVRPHLRNCTGCRATLREFRAAPVGLGAVVPIAAVVASQPAGSSDLGLVMRVYEAVMGGVHERVAHSAQKLQASVEAASTGKLAAVAASATAIAGGGVAVVDRRFADTSEARRQAGLVRARVPTPASAKPANRTLARAEVGLAAAEAADDREPDASPVAERSQSQATPRRTPSDTREFGFEAADSTPASEAPPPAPDSSSAGEPSAAAASASAGSGSAGGGEFGP